MSPHSPGMLDALLIEHAASSDETHWPPDDEGNHVITLRGDSIVVRESNDGNAVWFYAVAGRFDAAGPRWPASRSRVLRSHDRSTGRTQALVADTETGDALLLHSWPRTAVDIRTLPRIMETFVARLRRWRRIVGR